eukprot:6171992-Pleurochrysis_carterae.AAC.1
MGSSANACATAKPPHKMLVSVRGWRGSGLCRMLYCSTYKFWLPSTCGYAVHPARTTSMHRRRSHLAHGFDEVAAISPYHAALVLSQQLIEGDEARRGVVVVDRAIHIRTLSLHTAIAAAIASDIASAIAAAIATICSGLTAAARVSTKAFAFTQNTNVGSIVTATFGVVMNAPMLNSAIATTFPSAFANPAAVSASIVAAITAPVTRVIAITATALTATVVSATAITTTALGACSLLVTVAPGSRCPRRALARLACVRLATRARRRHWRLQQRHVFLDPGHAIVELQREEGAGGPNSAPGSASGKSGGRTFSLLKIGRGVYRLISKEEASA